MGAQLTPSLWGSHRNSEVSPQKKERKRRVEGHQGTPICPEASHFSRSGEGCVISLGEPEQSQDGVLPTNCFPLPGTAPAVLGPWSPRFLRSSCSQWGTECGRPRHPLASPLGGAGRFRSRASDFTGNQRQNRGVRRAGAQVPSLAHQGSEGGRGLGRAQSLRSVRAPARPRP